jgi:hypothetical protein
VGPVTPAVRRELEDARALPTPVERGREITVRDVRLIRQTSRTATVDALIDDGVARPYPVVFTLTGGHGRWEVSDLGDDE